MEQLDTHRTDCHEIWYPNIFQKSVEKFQVLLKCDKKNEYFTWRRVYIYDKLCRWIHLKMRNVSDKSCRKKSNTFYVKQLFYENRAIF